MRIFRVISDFTRDERGATVIEYTALVALLAVIVITAQQLAGGNIAALFGTTESGLSGVMSDIAGGGED